MQSIKNSILSIFLLFVFTISAQIPTTYYTSAEGKSAETLKTQLASIISAGAVDKGYDFLYTIYESSDNLPNGKVWDMYSLKSNGTADYYFTHNSDKCGSYSSESNCYNREHTFCDSWLGAASPQRSDAHHLIPTDGYVNNRRSSHPHGKVGSVSWTSSNGSKLGSSDGSTGYSGTVFEPIDEFKGDFARMYFYVATRYESKIGGWVGNGSAGEILAGNSYPAYKVWFYTLMNQWNNQDPVSQKEIDRNNAIYTYQKNRNPYIDYPDLVNFIWGSKKGQPWSINGSTYPTIISPTNGATIDFGKVAYLQTDTASFFLKVVNLTGDISLALKGTNANLFSLNSYSISKSEAENGIKVLVNYAAQQVGTHIAQLAISGGGITTTTLTLSAQSTDDFMALPATDITYSGFTANWRVSANATGYKLNVFKLTNSGTSQQKTFLDEAFISGLPSTWLAEGYTDSQTSGFIRLASAANPGKIVTPALDLSGSSNVLTVQAKQYNNDTGAPLAVSIDGLALTEWVTSSIVQTFSVNMPIVTSCSKISLSSIAGKRVYVDNIKIESVGEVQTQISVPGFPLSVGNIQSYVVGNLIPDSSYYYTVTPEGNSAVISNQIKVRTLLNSDINNRFFNSVLWKVNSNGIHLDNLPTENTVVTIYDVTGNLICSQQNIMHSTSFRLNRKGLYLIHLVNNKNSTALKVVF